ncbi:MAG: AAA family ATPase, partial [Burkholderiaceae bacterium]|nr:AAA family ATPase [Burkholderiaceae bacterium]
KPVNFGFVDFSTPQRRRRFCEEELRLNRRTAPALYLEVVPITRDEAGRLRFGGAGDAIDWAVRMRRFDPQRQLDRLARGGSLTAEHIDRLAAAIAAFHRTCPLAPTGGGYGSPRSVREVTEATIARLQSRADDETAARLQALSDWCAREFSRREGLWAARQAEGFVRECHGDLHLGNLVLLDGEPVAFDAIEFDAALRCIDVASDVAFAWMDLLAFGLPQLAARFVNAYLEDTGDYAALGVLRFYGVYRALVRALVAALRAGPQDAAMADGLRYLATAERIAHPPRPLLLATCGVTGSGKTTVAQHLLQALEAVRVRSDVERKRLAGRAATERCATAVGAGLYDAAHTQATYARLGTLAQIILDGGFRALVDATLQRRAQRHALRELARASAARFLLVVCEAPPAVLQARVAARLASGADASDATPAVLQAQLSAFEPVADDEADRVLRLRTDVPPQALAARCAALATELVADPA